MATLDSDLTSRFSSLDASSVTEIVDTDLTEPQINAFLNMSFYRSRPIAGNLDGCGGKSAEEQIVIMLAAHFVKVYEGSVSDEWVGKEWRVRYRGLEDGEGLRSSIYGQNAIAMDCSGKLATAGLKKADVYTVDTDRAEEYDIEVS